jgi:hypothetical protein
VLSRERLGVQRLLAPLHARVGQLVLAARAAGVGRPLVTVELDVVDGVAAAERVTVRL